MRSSYISAILFVSILFSLTGCNHYELPIFPKKTKTSSHKNSSSVDVNGVKDDVTSQKIVVRRIAFPVDEYTKLPTSGNSTVKGVISVSYNGHQLLGKQTRLYLNPVTTYSNQWYRESYLGGHKMGKSDPRLFNYLKFTASNVNGQFAFYGVPKGSYYVVGTVQCSECEERTIRIARKVTVNGANTVQIDLSKSL